MLFLPTCATVDYWSHVFPRVIPDTVKLPVFALHGKMKDKRYKVLENFRKADTGLLLCTDVLARGIDIQEVIRYFSSLLTRVPSSDIHVFPFFQIDWVLQWDPPANASAFVHRIGRTARQGNAGSALILLLETEAAYVHFIERNQRMQLNVLEDTASQEKVDELLTKLRDLQESDRDIMEKGTRAFVSHIRAYSKHECSLLLRVKVFRCMVFVERRSEFLFFQDLPLVDVALTYGLLRLPKMPELKNTDVSAFPAVPHLNIDKIPYKNKQREAVRLEKVEKYKTTGI